MIPRKLYENFRGYFYRKMEKQNDQIKRIKQMERHLNKANKAICSLKKSIENFKNNSGPIHELEQYYTSPLWKKDFQDDHKGILPSNLKRGVLSEDGIYNLLENLKEIKEELRDIICR